MKTENSLYRVEALDLDMQVTDVYRGLTLDSAESTAEYIFMSKYQGARVIREADGVIVSEFEV